MTKDQRFKIKNLGRLQRLCFYLLAAYVAFAALFYFAAAQDWDVQAQETKLMEPQKNMGILAGDAVLEQALTTDTDTLDKVSLVFGITDQSQEQSVTVSLVQAGQTLQSKTLLLKDITNNAYTSFVFDSPITIKKDQPAMIRISMEDMPAEIGLTVLYGDSVQTARGVVPLSQDRVFTRNGEPIHGSLAMSVSGRVFYHMSHIYLIIASAGFLLLLAVMLMQTRKFRKGESTLLIRIIVILDRYSYLIKQMVSRDFHIKYKRSVLGVLWSFLNPLLTMTVQYFVFSTLFRPSTENYMLYLLTGIVTFGYFSEAAGTGLNAIVGNASLITKVYVPKFIYPVIPVFSSTINMLFSLIPLLGVMLLTGAPFTKAMLLLPIGILYIMVFSIGMSLILSTSMVFFRDTKFLWGVLSMLWNFLTPIFYMESIIPAQFIGLYHMNPMYQFVYFMRTIVIGGVSPNPMTYLYCTIAAVIPLLIGLFLFRKNQNKFVFNL